MESKKEKLYLNGIPVYRTTTDEYVQYVLFEDDEINGSLIRINRDRIKNYFDEYRLVLDCIVDKTGSNEQYYYGVNVGTEDRNKVRIEGYGRV